MECCVFVDVGLRVSSVLSVLLRVHTSSLHVEQFGLAWSLITVVPSTQWVVSRAWQYLGVNERKG